MNKFKLIKFLKKDLKKYFSTKMDAIEKGKKFAAYRAVDENINNVSCTLVKCIIFYV
jgi:hypothetical protein